MKFEAIFGGPDRPRGYLRDKLSEHIVAVPSGGEIDWVTYYFRDRRLAQDLLQARHRGVRVRLTLEKSPRTGRANEQVLSMLSGPDGLGDGLRAVTHRLLPGLLWMPHLHEKIYCFSHPRPIALVGSFNPSGDDPETEPDIIDEILDHDRGHNLLVGIHGDALVDGLVQHTRRMHDGGHGILERFDTQLNEPLRDTDTTIHFWPRAGRDPLAKFLEQFGKGTKVRFAASHMKGPGSASNIANLARRGATVEILAESSLRRVPGSIEHRLLDAGVKITRYPMRENIPMHNKFALIENHSARWTVFGSYNWTARSRWLNHEVCVISRDLDIFNQIDQRWSELVKMPEESAVEA